MRVFWLAIVTIIGFLSGSVLAADSGVWLDLPSPKKYGEPEIIRGLLSLPGGEGPSPAVVLMHGCSGLSDGAVMTGLENHAAALRDAGFATLILDSFGPRGIAGGVVCETFEALGKARYKRRFDAFGAHAYLSALREIDNRNIFLMGQSNGGSVAVLMAQPQVKKDTGQDRAFRAVTAFYPWCGAFKGSKLMSPLLVLAGSADDWTPPKACVDRESHMDGADYAVEIYEGAHHSFDLPIPVLDYKGHTVGGDAAATKLARARMIDFFKSHLVP